MANFFFHFACQIFAIEMPEMAEMAEICHGISMAKICHGKMKKKIEIVIKT
jgi:hypothetical protein